MTEQAMFELMDFANGELRVMAGRYGGGWIACGCAGCEWDFDEQWSDLVGGDLDYFSARDFFNAHDDCVLVESAESPRAALDNCIQKLTEIKG